MINENEIQEISDELIRELRRRMNSVACAQCGATEASSADLNVLRQLLRDNEFRGIMPLSQVTPMRPISQVPFPQEKAAHG